MSIELLKNNKALFVGSLLAMSSLVSCNDEKEKEEKNEILKQRAEVIQIIKEDFAKDSIFSLIDQLNSEDLKLFVEYTLPNSFNFQEIEDIQRYLKIRKYIVNKGTITWTDIDDAVEQHLKASLSLLSFQTVEDIEKYVRARNYIVAFISLTNDDIDSYVFYYMIQDLASHNLSTPEGLKTYIAVRDYIAKNLNINTEEIDDAVKDEKKPKFNSARL